MPHTPVKRWACIATSRCHHRDTARIAKGIEIGTKTGASADSGFLNKHAMQQNLSQLNFKNIKIIRNKYYLLMHK